ncbi:MAG TPA: 4'-phosphopantetheinyl transferase superfamily protein [Candidatus Sulfotelmatobacter sp.]|nr:4'-phosphopantetheinyl transferase superfamily protein [Candidatus Sulfotelmatobacter sp.]
MCSQLGCAAMGPEIRVEIRDFGDAGSAPTALPFNVVHAWWRSLREPDAVVRACYELLSREERERASRYRVEGPREDFILTRGTLRSLLAGYQQKTPKELTFQLTEYGKPFIAGPCDLRFNVSHTDGLALLAFVRQREIGVDVERIRPEPDAQKLAERFFSLHERRALENLNGDELQTAFFRCWSRKEAYIKARGGGLSLALDQFDVSIEANESRVLLATRPDPAEANRWVVRDLATRPEYAAAVAVATAVDG